MTELLAIILVGGKGERLYPLTEERAKPAVPFGGIYRIIDFTLSNCVNSNVRKIFVLTQYKSHSLNHHLKEGWNLFSYEFGEYIDIIPAQQRIGDEWYLGTADAVYQNIFFIERESPEYLLILSGDHIYKMDYDKMLEFHRDKDAEMTIASVEVSKERASDLGIIETDYTHRIVGFEEKPAEPKTIPGRANLCFASMGVYVFNTEVLLTKLQDCARGRNGTDSTRLLDFGRDVIPAMIHEVSAYAYNFRDENKKVAKYWRDVGTIDSYWKVNMDLVAVTPEFNLYDTRWPIRTFQGQYPPAKFVFAQEYKGGRLGMAVDSIVSAGCIISGGRVQRSVLSPKVRINSYAEVYQSILFEGVEVGRHARIRKAIIDKDVKIPAGMEIGYDLKEDRKIFTVSESGVVVVPKGATLRVPPCHRYGEPDPPPETCAADQPGR